MKKNQGGMHSGRPSRPGPTTGSAVQGETEALVGPITPKAELHYRSETTELYRCYRIGDMQSLKDK